MARVEERMPRASIIVVSYNGLQETTAPCLRSIFRNTADCDYEVIVVDNNSSDGTREYLAELAGREPRLRLVLNESNRGFAGGNNDGIRASLGDYVVLLNSDTMVMEGWLGGLVGVLEKDASVGLAGPVSNSVGNEQQIFTRGRRPEDVMEEGRAWCAVSRGDVFETDLLSFFCVAIRREAIDRVGLLDEGFGLGFYEDDDYCIRARTAGYRLVCAEDVFVYHKGSASFSIPDESKMLMKRNKRMLEAKLNISYRPRHPRYRQLDVIAFYIENFGTDGSEERLGYKINNRLQLLKGIRPRGFFKRLFFERRLRALKSELERSRMRSMTTDPE